MSFLFLQGNETYNSEYTIGTPAYLNLDALNYRIYSRQTDFWALALTAYKLEQKDNVVPLPPPKVDLIEYYADAIENGVRFPGGKSKPFKEHLLKCKAIAPLLTALTDEHLAGIGDFLSSSELKMVMSHYELTLENINEGNQLTSKYIKQ